MLGHRLWSSWGLPGHVTGVMDDQCRASAGVPCLRTKGFTASNGLNEDSVEKHLNKGLFISGVHLQGAKNFPTFCSQSDPSGKR